VIVIVNITIYHYTSPTTVCRGKIYLSLPPSLSQSFSFVLRMKITLASHLRTDAEFTGTRWIIMEMMARVSTSDNLYLIQMVWSPK
jgi:hypothetical protein